RAVRHRAEGAVSRAGVAEQHERGRLVGPALSDVRAMRFLAHGVESQLADGRHRFREAWTARGADLEPRGMPACDLAHSALATSSGSQPAYPKRATNSARTTGRTAATSDAPPSRVTDVISTPEMPQGVIRAKGARSSATFSAKPCQATHRRTAMPIEAIFRPSTQTPRKPSRRPAPIPNVPSAPMRTSSIIVTYQRTSVRNARRSTIGYPTSCPGPWYVTCPPRCVRTTGTPPVAAPPR